MRSKSEAEETQLSLDYVGGEIHQLTKAIHKLIEILSASQQTKDRETTSALDPHITSVLDTHIDDLEMSVRLANALKQSNIQYVGELAQKTPGELLSFRSIGLKMLREIKELLMGMELNLEFHPGNWLAPKHKHKDQPKPPDESKR